MSDALPPSLAASWREVALVLAIVWVPGVVYGAGLLAGGRAWRGNEIEQWAWALSSLACIALATSREGSVPFWPRRLRGWEMDTLLGVGVGAIGIGVLVGWHGFASSTGLLDVLWHLLPKAPDYVFDESLAHSWRDLPLLFLFALVEEVVCRGYLLTRLPPLVGTRRAVFVAALVFAVAHLPQGAVGLASSFVFGLVMGGLFLLLRRVWPLAVGHFLVNAWLSVA